MTEDEAIKRMVAPGTVRPGKWRGGVIQIWVTRACDKACYHCTQGSNLASNGKPVFITPEQFDAACTSLKGYWGVVGVFGGNPALHPKFEVLCEIMKARIPFEQRGLWCNNPLGKGQAMQRTFNPAVSNLNVHLDREAYNEFKRDWPESHVVGLDNDSRHSPVHLAMKDVLKKPCPNCSGRGYFNTCGCDDPDCNVPDPCTDCDGTGKVYDEEKAWELISRCDINQHWSAMIGVFRGELRAWFCEVAGAQAMLHQHEPDYPDTGLELWCDPDLSTPGVVRSGGIKLPWWTLAMPAFAHQVRKHCHECGVPLRGYGQLAQATEGPEQTSDTHANVYRPKRTTRDVQIVTTVEELRAGALPRMTDYLQNARR